jgi:hypothetical protein
MSLMFMFLIDCLKFRFWCSCLKVTMMFGGCLLSLSCCLFLLIARMHCISRVDRYIMPFWAASLMMICGVFSFSLYGTPLISSCVRGLCLCSCSCWARSCGMIGFCSRGCGGGGIIPGIGR